MKRALIYKEIKDVFFNKTSLIYFFLLFSLISYSFYSAVDLYSKASLAAIDNPLYATGFEPVSGVFTPTFGGFFLILSLIAPFLFIRSISNEVSNNTITLLAQFPYSLGFVFFAKFLSIIIVLIFSVFTFLPVIVFWKLLGGYLPIVELSVLILGYFLYGIFVLSVSFFSASFFKSNSQASIFSIAVIVFSWFIDFGKDMNILSLFKTLSDWTVTARLKYFEDGILSFQSIAFFLVISSFFLFLGYLFFNITIKNKLKPILCIIFISLILFIPLTKYQYNIDISESKKNSFSNSKNEFLKELPYIGIKIFLEPTDSRFKDYERDFLKKLKMVKNGQEISFAKGETLKKNYGSFKYSIGNKSETTYSNSENEIFMILENLSGYRVKKSLDSDKYKGYPLVVKKNITHYIFLLYMLILFLIIFCVFLKRRKKDEI